MILPPPSPFLDAKDLNSRYASQVRKLSNQPMLLDGDAAFYKVDTRRPAHELESGVAADAVNKMFVDGRAWPRFGVNQQPWGNCGVNLIPAGTAFGNYYGHGSLMVLISGFTVGQKYLYVRGSYADGQDLLVISPDGVGYNQVVSTGGTFTATQTSYYVAAPAQPTNPPSPDSGALVRAHIFRVPNPCAYNRFNDPQGIDTQVQATDDWRDGVGEDGGRGRVWKIISGNMPVSVPLNGHDVYGTSRFIACYNGLVLLRQDNERHYFSATASLAITGSTITGSTITVDTTTLTAGLPVTVSGITGASGTYYAGIPSAGLVSLYDTAAHAIAGGGTGCFAITVNGQTGTLNKLAVNPATSRIQLNATPNWANGDKVFYWADLSVGSSITGGSAPPNARTQYYVKNIAGNLVELYTDAGLTTKLNFTTALGRFYLERQADFPGFYGNGAPPLLAQPNALGAKLWDVGFMSIPVTVQITGTSNAAATPANVVTAANHRLVPGDAITLTNIHTTGNQLIGLCYACPTSANTLTLYTSATAAVAAANSGSTSSQIPLLNNNETGTLTKSGASGLPTPPGREGCYVQNRLVIVNQACTLAISDPLDPLHYTPFTAALTANLGESDPISFITPFGTDSLLIAKQNSLELLENLSQGSAGWTLANITREYGCLAPLSWAQTGNDVWFLSRKGVASVTQTVQGVVQGVALPVSSDVQKYIEQIDWNHASQASGAYWNNRYFVAVPLKGQVVASGGTPVNNGILVHNFLNVDETPRVYKDEPSWGWEGLWQGAALQVYAFARFTVYGDERLCFVNPAGQVGWFGNGFTDGVTPISDLLLTRRYVADAPARKLWLETQILWDTNNPTLTVTAVAPGYNEATVLASGLTYDATQYLVYGQAAYNPAASTPATFSAPDRSDYKLTPGEVLTGALDVHQNITEKFRLRLDDWGVQIQITNASGSARIQAVGVSGVRGPKLGTRNV